MNIYTYTHTHTHTHIYSVSLIGNTTKTTLDPHPNNKNSHITNFNFITFII